MLNTKKSLYRFNMYFASGFELSPEFSIKIVQREYHEKKFLSNIMLNNNSVALHYMDLGNIVGSVLYV